jgi:Cu/Zn superoxide dismutase
MLLRTKTVSVVLSLSVLALASACERGQSDDELPNNMIEAERSTPVADPPGPGERLAPEGAPGREPEREAMTDVPPPPSVEPAATAELQAADGVKLEGEAKLYEDESGVRVVIDVKSAPPGFKGVHVHEKGDCSDIPGKSMGSHFAPEGNKHALPAEISDGLGHLGDLGNIRIDEKGEGRLDIKATGANL